MEKKQKVDWKINKRNIGGVVHVIESQIMNNKCSSYVYFAFKGDDFVPSDITERLGIEPTESWQTGDKGKYKKELTFSYWKLSTEKGIEYLDIDKLISKIIHKLKDKIDIINELKHKYQLDSVLQIVLDIDLNPDQSTPYLGHDLEVIDFLFNTQTKTDIDIYRFDSRDK